MTYKDIHTIIELPCARRVNNELIYPHLRNSLFREMWEKNSRILGVFGSSFTKWNGMWGDVFIALQEALNEAKDEAE